MHTATLVAPACPPAAAGRRLYVEFFGEPRDIYKKPKSNWSCAESGGSDGETNLGKKVGNGLKKLGNIFSSWNS